MTVYYGSSSASSITVTWSAPSTLAASDYTSYGVYTNISTPASTLVCSLSSTNTRSCTFPTTAGQTYDITVYAYQSSAIVAYSPTVRQVATSVPVISGSITSTVTANSITFYWNTVNVNFNGNTGSFAYNFNGAGEVLTSSTTATFTSLNPNVNYTLALRYRNAQTYYSNILATTALTSPGAPNATGIVTLVALNSTAVRVDWASAFTANGGAPLRYSLFRISPAAISLFFDQYNTSYTETGFYPGDPVRYTVLAKNTGGEWTSLSSAMVNTVPKNPVMSPATNYTTSTDASWPISVTVNYNIVDWNAGYNTGATQIPGFFLCTVSKAGVYMLLANTTGTSCTFSNQLLAYTTYNVSINATNIFGLVSNSVTAQVLTASDYPELFPSGLVTGTVASTSVSCSWSSMVIRWNGPPPYTFNVEYTDNVSSSPPEFSRFVTTSATSATITGLKPYTNYLIQVEAVNGAGLSSSASFFAKTTGQIPVFLSSFVTFTPVVANATSYNVTVDWASAIVISGAPSVSYYVTYSINGVAYSKTTTATNMVIPFWPQNTTSILSWAISNSASFETSGTKSYTTPTMTISSATPSSTRSSATPSVTPSSASPSITPFSATPFTATSSATPSLPLASSTRSSATPSVTPASVTPSSTRSSATPASATPVSTTSSALPAASSTALSVTPQPSSATPDASPSSTSSSTAGSGTNDQASSSSSIAPIAGAAAGVIILIIFVVFFMLYMRRKRGNRKHFGGRLSSAEMRVLSTTASSVAMEDSQLPALEKARISRNSGFTRGEEGLYTHIGSIKAGSDGGSSSSSAAIYESAVPKDADYASPYAKASNLPPRPLAPKPNYSNGRPSSAASAPTDGYSVPYDENDIYYSSLNEKNLLPFQRTQVRAHLELEAEIGSGQFGQVFRGSLPLRQVPADCHYLIHPEHSAAGKLTVAVKMLKNDSDAKSRAEFIEEAKLMSSFAHSNIVRVIAALIDTDPYMIVLEMLPHGDLKNLMRQSAIYSYRWTETEFLHTLVQIASGMEYLSGIRFVHRDLAARNCLIGDSLVVKVADFGLSRQFAKEKEYYTMESRGKLPIKWMAMESIQYRKFSPASDVWSFGIVGWELYSYGASPYGNMTKNNVLEFLEQGKRLEIPESCTPTVFSLFLRCWDSNANARPTFGDCKLFLLNLLNKAKARQPVVRDIGRDIHELVEQDPK